MTHSGKWEGRDKMAWRSWYLGAAMLIAGTIAIFTDKDAAGLFLYGSGLIASIIAIMVGGKVWHDKEKK